MLRGILVLASISGALCALPASAQVPILKTPSSSRTDASKAVAEDAQQAQQEQHHRLVLDEFLVLVPLRYADDIRADIERSRDAEERAQESKRDAERLERLARDQLEAQKREIDAIKARLKIAKNEDRDTDVMA